MSVDIINFGCRLNIYEGEAIKAKAAGAGLSDAIIINSCTVTAEADRQVRQNIRRLHKEYPSRKIIVTGCGAQVHPEQFAAMPEVDHVIGNEEKLHESTYKTLSETLFRADTQKIFVNDIMSVKETASHMVSTFEGRARAFVQVQNGCNHRCTFCIIPFGRGNSRSVPAGEVVTEIQKLVADGFNEVVLTGVDISDYGGDLPGKPNLGSLLERIFTHVPNLPRLRLSSIDAAEVDAQTEHLFATQPRLMPHVHLSLQAGDDMILKRMKRRHNRADILDFAKRLRNLRPDVVFGADIIAGFPTETEAMFQNSLNIVEEVGLTYLHVFPYSARTGTPAAKMPQVPKALRKERAQRLREAGEKQFGAYLKSLIGTQQTLVMEQGAHGRTLGRTEGFAPALLAGEFAQGSLQRVIITDVENQKLTCASQH